MRGRKRQSEQSAKAAGKAFPSWTHRWTYLPSSLLTLRLQRKKFSPSTLKSTNNRDYWGPAQGARADGGGGVLLQRPPRMEGGEDIWCCCKALIHQLPALKEQSSQEEGNLCGEKFGNHEGGSPEGPSHGCYPQR